jgi:hypothetical protein
MLLQLSFILLFPGSVTAAATADLVVGDFLKIAGNEIFDHRADVHPFAIMIYLNTDLLESHERPHADAADYQGIDPGFSQKIDRHHAATLDMFLVGENGNLFDLSVFDIKTGEDITVTEVSCPFAV